MEQTQASNNHLARLWLSVAAVVLITIASPRLARCVPNCSVTTVTLPSGPVPAGSQVTLIGTTTAGGPFINCNAGQTSTAVTTGTIEIREYEAQFKPVPCSVGGICTKGDGLGSNCFSSSDCGNNGFCQLANFVLISSGTPNASGQYSTLFNTSTLDTLTTVGFIADFTDGNTPNTNSTSQCFNLTISP